MNYLPFCGHWFYGGASPSETASLYLSYGLLFDAPEITIRPGNLMNLSPHLGLYM